MKAEDLPDVALTRAAPALPIHLDPDLDVSVVIPVFNEVDNVVPLADTVVSVLQATGKSFEVLFVDDGSTDGTVEKLVALHADRPVVKVVELRANFGKAAALQAGFLRARGEVVITMDGDLQDVPEEIPRFLSEMDKGFDLVSGWKQNRQDPIGKTWPSKFFNTVTRIMSGVKLHDFNCGFKAYRRDVVRQLNLLRRAPPLHPGAWCSTSKGSSGEVPVKHQPRRFGKSKYGIDRFWKGFVDLVTVLFLTKYTRRPLHLYGMLGALSAVLGTGILAYLSVLWFGGLAIGGRPLLFLGILLIVVGIQFFTTGLVAEMITHMSARHPEDVHVRKFHG
ncbi:MAG: glycosyltransferase family 2 protein [Acidobacteriota bacterium]